MDLSTLKTLNLSLTDYLGKGKTGSAGQNLLNSVAARYSANAQSGAGALTGDTVTLSEEAKALLSATGGENENLTGVQKAAQNFMIGFFDQSGVETEKLSDSVLDIIEGLNGVIAGSTATGRDFSTDSLEMQHGENGRKVYTLAGQGTRLRLAIDYADDKTTPVKLSITDITGGKVETANITITNDDDGVTRLNIERTQLEYKNGHMISAGDIDPLSMRLYTA